MQINSEGEGNLLHWLVTSLPHLVGRVLWFLNPGSRMEMLQHKDDLEQTPLHRAVAHQKRWCMESILRSLGDDERVEILKMKDIWHNTALHIAVSKSLYSVSIILDSVLDYTAMVQLLKIEDAQGATPLYWAAIGSQELLKYMMSKLRPNDTVTLLSLKDLCGLNTLQCCAVLSKDSFEYLMRLQIISLLEMEDVEYTKEALASIAKLMISIFMGLRSEIDVLLEEFMKHYLTKCSCEYVMLLML